MRGLYDKVMIEIKIVVSAFKIIIEYNYRNIKTISLAYTPLIFPLD